MRFNNFRKKVEKILLSADVKIDGNRPWDIRVYNDNLFARLMAEGSMGLGESYVEGWWDCKSLDSFFHKTLRAGLDTKVVPWTAYFSILQAKLFNLQKPSRAFHIGRHHYDIGNDLFECMLDKHMIYSCGYWQNAATLDEAQEHKLDLVCQKLDLQPGMRVLDIGCGWGGAARFAANKYDVEVIGITVSEKQAKFARKSCKEIPVDILLQDYRGLRGTFDRIFSLGMIEHVGYKNYRTFMKTAKTHLADDGLFLLHTIGGNRSVTTTDPWISRYIFPNSMIPSAKQLAAAIEDIFVLEDWQNFGADYDTTLMHWFENFDNNWHSIKNNYDERFYRMWKYFLLSCAGSFRARKNQVWQLVLSPHGIPGGYKFRRQVETSSYNKAKTDLVRLE